MWVTASGLPDAGEKFSATLIGRTIDAIRKSYDAAHGVVNETVGGRRQKVSRRATGLDVDRLSLPAGGDDHVDVSGLPKLPASVLRVAEALYPATGSAKDRKKGFSRNISRFLDGKSRSFGFGRGPEALADFRAEVLGLGLEPRTVLDAFYQNRHGLRGDGYKGRKQRPPLRPALDGLPPLPESVWRTAEHLYPASGTEWHLRKNFRTNIERFLEGRSRSFGHDRGPAALADFQAQVGGLGLEPREVLSALYENRRFLEPKGFLGRFRRQAGGGERALDLVGLPPKLLETGKGLLPATYGSPEFLRAALRRDAGLFRAGKSTRFGPGNGAAAFAAFEDEAKAAGLSPEHVLKLFVQHRGGLVALRNLDRAKQQAPARKLAAGGWLVPGTGEADSVPADLPVGSYVLRKQAVRENPGVVRSLLMPGEVVVGPDRVRQVGVGALDRLNRRRFADGGPVYGFAGDVGPRSSTDAVRALLAAAAAEPAPKAAAPAGTTLNDLLRSRTAGALGGLPVVSQSTVTSTLGSETARVQREYVEAVSRQVATLNKGSPAAEAVRVAEERFADELAGRGRGLRVSRSGRVRGAEDLAAELEGRGLPAGGRPTGVLSRWVSRSEGLSRLAGRVEGGLERFGGPGLAIASGYAPVLLEQMFGKPGEAGATSGSRLAAGVGGAIQTAGTFGTLGMAGGPWAAAATAAAGALVGFSSAVREADEAVRSTRIERGLSTLALRTDALTKGEQTASDAAGSEAALAGLRRELSERALEGSRRHVLGVAVTNPDAADLTANDRGEVRQTLGPRLGTLSAALNARVEQLGRRNPGADADALFKSFESSHKQMLGAVADLSERSLADTRVEYQKLLKDAQTSARARLGLEAALAGAQRVTTSFGRLTDAVDRAGDSLGVLDARGVALAGGLDQPRPGTGEPTPERLQRLLAPLGPLGEPVLRAGRTADRLGRDLPTVLAGAASTPLLEGDSFADRVRTGLRGLGGGRPDAERSRALDLVSAQLERMTQEEVAKAVRGDVTAFARDLLAPYADPVRNTQQGLARRFDSYHGRAVELANQSNATGAAAGLEEDRVAELELARRRAPYVFRQQNPDDHLPVPALQAPFAAAQVRLAGPLGDDPAGIARRLDRLRGEIDAAVVARETAGAGPGYAKAVLDMSKLTAEADNLRGALRNLADVGKSAAGIQAKLNALESDRQSRLGYAERYFTSDQAGRYAMRRGLALVTRAQQAGSILPFGARQQGEVLRALSDLGSAKLGGERADELKARLLGQATGGLLTPADKTEKNALEGQLLEAMRKAAEAQGTLAKDLRSAQTDFLRLMAEQNASFLREFQAGQADLHLADRQVQLGEASGRLSRLRAAEGSYRLLTRAGVGDDEQLKALRERRGDVEALAASLQQVDRLHANRAAIAAGLGADGPAGWTDAETNVGNWGRTGVPAEVLLRARGRLDPFKDRMTPDQQDAVLRTFADEAASRSRQAWNARDMVGMPTAVRARAVRGVLDQTLVQSVSLGLLGEEGKLRRDQAGIFGRLGPVGLDPARLAGAIGTGGGKEFLAALDAFGKDLPFGRFGDSLGAAAKTVDELADSVHKLRAVVDGAEAPKKAAAGAAVGGAAFAFARGGWVPGLDTAGPLARGTDRTLAVLSKDEFVVRASAAKRHGRLLEQLNRGDVDYRAGGGWVGGAPEETAYERADRHLAAARHERNRLAEADEMGVRRAAARRKRAETGFRPGELYGLSEGYGKLVRGEATSSVTAEQVAAAQAAAGGERGGRRTLGQLLRANPLGAVAMGLAAHPRTKLALARDAAAAEARLGRAFADDPSMGRVFAGVAGAARSNEFGTGTEDLLLGHDDGIRGFFAAGRVARRQDAAFRRMFGLGGAPDRSPLAGFNAGQGLEDKVLGLAGLPPRRFFSGGVVGGVGQSDSVPAALRPGEGVLSPTGMRNAGGAAGLARLNGGSGTDNSAALEKALLDFGLKSAAMAEKLSKFSDAVGRFVPVAHELAEAMNNFPREVEHKGEIRAEVSLVGGAEILHKLDGTVDAIAGRLDDIVHGAIDQRVPTAEQRRPGT